MTGPGNTASHHTAHPDYLSLSRFSVSYFLHPLQTKCLKFCTSSMPSVAILSSAVAWFMSIISPSKPESVHGYRRIVQVVRVINVTPSETKNVSFFIVVKSACCWRQNAKTISILVNKAVYKAKLRKMTTANANAYSLHQPGQPPLEE